MLQILLLQASYTEGQHHGEEGKEKQTNKGKNNKTSNPSHSPKQYHTCLDMGTSVPIDWNKMSGKPSDSRKPLEPVQHILHEWMNECKHRDYCKREIQSKFCSTITETVSISWYRSWHLTASVPTQLYNEELPPPHFCKQLFLALPDKKFQQTNKFLICSPLSLQMSQPKVLK